MNIAVFTDTYPPFINGVSTSTFNLVKTLKEHGHNVLLITTRHDDGKLEYKDGIVYIPGIELKKIYGYRLTKFYSRKVIQILKSWHIDVIHNQTDVGVGQFSRIAAHRLKIPSVYTYHTAYEDYTYYAVHGLLDRFAKHLMRGYAKIIAKGCTEFITPSQKTKDYMRSVGSDIYVNVVPTGIDFALFDEKNIDKNRQEQFKKDHHIGPNTKVFLILGRVAKEKSMDYSIRGFAKYHQKHPNDDIKMIVVGDGPQKNELELLTHELKIDHLVDFIGKVPAEEVPFYYHLADIYTSASITETQGLTFMEAMASKTLVLARFDANLSDTIIDGETGFFFTSEEGFVEKVERIFDLSKVEKDTIIKTAYEKADMYSIERFYTNIIGVYRRAIKKYW